MFKFNFGVDDCNAESFDNPLETHLIWTPSEEVPISKFSYNVNCHNIDVLSVGKFCLKCVKPSSILASIKQDPEHTNKGISLAEERHSDLIPSKYEGGLKVWESTYDIARYITPSLINGKSVLDLGCGLGLLGISTLKLGAQKVTFQDYNKEVVQFTTIPNVQINADPDQVARCRFYLGDWESFAQLVECQFDVVLTSETIYNPNNYLKLHNAILRVLKPDGIAIVAAKSYYFGVGGSMREFEKLVKAKDVFNIEIVWKCQEVEAKTLCKVFDLARREWCCGSRSPNNSGRRGHGIRDKLRLQCVGNNKKLLAYLNYLKEKAAPTYRELASHLF